MVGVATNKELKEVLTQFDKQRLHRETSIQKIKRSFNPRHVLNSGGVFEMMINSLKEAIGGQLNNAGITDEELLLAFAGTWRLINSRRPFY